MSNVQLPKDAQFKDVGSIAAHILHLKRDKQGLFRTQFGKKSSHGLAKFFMGLVFVYYRQAFISLAAKQKLPANLYDLKLTDIMNEIDPRYEDQ